jgi:hypothetical protein
MLGVAVLVSVFCGACASTSWPDQVNASVIADAPDHFLVLDVATGVASEPTGWVR